MTRRLQNFFVWLALALALAPATRAQLGGGDHTPTPADTVISNQAEATYTDDTGAAFATVSPTITVTVLPVVAVSVTPDETAPSAVVGPRERVTRVFRVCDTGNTPDLYTVTRAAVTAPAALVSLYFDADASGTVTQGDPLVTLDQTLSPRLAPGACVGVLVVLDTNEFPANSLLTVTLTARANVAAGPGGLAQDDGTIINTVGAGVRLTSPVDTQLPPVKLVEEQGRVTAAPGQALNYSITFRNSGDVTARNVVVADLLPEGLVYVPGSLKLGDRALTDQADADEGRALPPRQFEVRLSEVAPAEVVRVTFQARVTGQIPAGTGAVNNAVVSADNAPAINTSDAIAVVDPFGTVYAGRSGGALTIAGARVTLVTDEQAAVPLSVTPDIGFAPNTHNENPFTTPGGGRFNFVLTPEQFGTQQAPARYFLHVTAPGYRSRLIELSLRPNVAGLYAATVRALDAQPVAEAGSFALTEQPVELARLAALVFNVPMFENNALEISKTADQQRAEIGDVVTYRVEIRNPTAAGFDDVTVHDTLPQSFHYAPGTARVEGAGATARAVEPDVQGNALTFHLGPLAAGAQATLTYRVRIGVNAREGESVNSAFVAARDPLGAPVTSAPARASVRVTRGIFSTRQIVLGRVFADANGNGRFDDGERGVAGVRLYLPNGQSVTTDPNGMYNLPAVDDGAVVLALDPTTLPKGFTLADADTRDGRSWTRLLRTPLGGGGLLRQNFALNPPPAGPQPDDQPTQGDAKPASDNAQPTRGDNEPTPTQKARFTSTDDGARTLSTSATPNTPDTNAPHTNTSTINSPPANGAGASATATATPTAAPSVPLAPGTYEVEATETLAPVAPGALLLVAPAAEEVIRTPALSVEARVAEGWTVTVEIGGTRAGGANLGETRVDHRSRTVTYSFVGLNLRPGPNRLRVMPVSPEGVAGAAVEQTVYGRGPAVRLEIVADRKELQGDGRDETLVRVRAYDQWNHPAADAPVAIETSSGRLLSVRGAQGAQADQNDPTKLNVSTRNVPDLNQEQTAAGARQQFVSLAGGEAVVRLVADTAAGEAELHASAGTTDARGEVRFTPELRPTLLVGLAEVSVGRAAPENALRGTDSTVRSHVEFYYRGRVFGQNLLTLAYDSQRPINRTAGRDRLFQLDPLERAYPLFGDTSTRAEDAQSNSKVYARLDRNRSYAMFGDFDTEQSDLGLASYARRLTGVKVHVENERGDFLAATGARPDTAFTRDVFAAGRLGLIQLSYGDILPGSETVTLEVRDRRNPELLLSRETLARSVDYNLDPTAGVLFMLRPVSAFDYALNLVQLVVTYEHRAAGLSSAVYTARGVKHITRTGTRLGFSFVEQRQADLGAFKLAGLDGEQRTPRGGRLQFEWAASRGAVATTGNLFDEGDTTHDGNAYRLEWTQPLPFREAVLRASYARADEGFINPFGATVTPGSQRAVASVDVKLRRRSTLRLALMDERNRTANVNNERQTASLLWTETFTDRLRATFGYDFRNFTDALNDKRTTSNLVSAGVEWQATDKLQLAVKREQNLGDADPTYPDQTTLAANYQWNSWARLFFTQRLAAAPIVPISDAAATGFAATGSRRETAVGVETKLGRNTALSGRYQLENGANGTDSFAVVGLQNRLPLNERLALDFSFERGFHMAGAGESFTGGGFGLSYLANKDLRTAARYELRQQAGGMGQLFTVGAAGRLTEGATTLARFQWSHSDYQGRATSSLIGTAALALRPVNSDTKGLLFSYTHRDLSQDGVGLTGATTERSDVLSTDGYWQPERRTELFGRFALKFGANGRDGLIPTSALTYITQLRAARRLHRALDAAVEYRFAAQPATHTTRTSAGVELGYWVVRDVRFAVGYNFTAAGEPGGVVLAQPRGFYFTISTKLSNLFDLFGTAAQGLAVPTDAGAPPVAPKVEPKTTPRADAAPGGGQP
ncbi:MAG TPA: isopeptide-forming domain-containing fimbrial protein [Pyrinomonadaceae bacterium]|jgi:uncharacterized repeat protein (TIGR01451 family)